MNILHKLTVLSAICILFLCGCGKQPLPPETSAPTQPPARSGVSAFWLDSLSKKPLSFTEYIADSNEFQSHIVLIPDGEITELKLLTLEFIDVTEDGHVAFHTEEVFSPDIFTEARPLILGITFFGDLPNYGISYVDNYGELQQYALQISGENGDLLLLPF